MTWPAVLAHTGATADPGWLDLLGRRRPSVDMCSRAQVTSARKVDWLLAVGYGDFCAHWLVGDARGF